jgi:hypothetical protein
LVPPGKGWHNLSFARGRVGEKASNNLTNQDGGGQRSLQWIQWQNYISGWK